MKRKTCPFELAADIYYLCTLCQCYPQSKGLFPTLISLSRLMEWTVIAALETTIHYGRSHPFYVCLAVLGLYIVSSWFVGSQKNLNLPRVYSSDSNIFYRTTDIFRIFFRAEEAFKNGYRQVSFSCHGG